MAPYGKLQADFFFILRKLKFAQKQKKKGLTRKTTGKLDRVGLSHDRSEEFKSRSIYKLISYLTEKPMTVHNWDQPVNAVQGSNCFLSYDV